MTTLRERRKFHSAPVVGGCLVGILVWALAGIAGVREAWHVMGYYVPALVVGGLALGVLIGRGALLISLGVLLGQLLYILLFLWPVSPLFIAGIFELVILGIFPLLASLIGIWIKRLRLRRLAEKSSASSFS